MRIIMNLAGKSILLTGASSGIGYKLAEKLAAENCRIAVLARRTVKLQEIAEKFGNRQNVILPITCDVSKKEEVHSAVEKVLENFGEIDIIILNAGTSHRIDAKDFYAGKGEEIISVNLTSKFYFLEKIIPYFISKRSGMIVGVSSLADTRGFPRSAFYNASKAGFTKLLESLRNELYEYNIQVLNVRPGFVKTAMTDKNEFYMPFLMDVDKAAEIILKGIRKEKRIIQFPLPTVLGTKLISIMPDILFDYLSRKHLEGLKKKNL